jgi:hypothetical protein
MFVTADFISMREGTSREHLIVKNLLAFYESLRFHLFSKKLFEIYGYKFLISVRSVREIKQPVLGGLKQTKKVGDTKHRTSC